MRLLRAFVLALALLACAGGARAQDKTSHDYTMTVGHVVTLTWTASVSTVIGYNVYVSGTTGGPYFPIGFTTTLQFSDRDATAGNTYFYVVTAVDSNGIESDYSNEVAVTIPTP